MRLHRPPHRLVSQGLPLPGTTSFLRLCLICTLLAAGLLPHEAPCAQQHLQGRPNVVILLADDQGWGDLGISGNTNVRTPHIDSLASRGVSLERFYVCPVCSPTRAEFLTGRYHLRTGVRGVDSGRERMNPDERTIADAFKAAGYATGIFGKWHNGGQGPYHPNARGFDEFYGFTAGHWGFYFDAPLEHNGRPVTGKGFIADDLTDHALAFIEQNRARPFLCYVPFNIPHSPFCVPDAYWERFRDASVPLRAEKGVNEDLPTTRCVLAMTENLDWNVGRILARLDELRLAEDTIVVYFSDNGPNTWRWNGGMKGKKGSVDEGGVRSPCFIRWPGRLRAGKKIEEIAGAIDLLPTLLALTAVPGAGGKRLDGWDLAPLLTGGSNGWPERMLFSHWGGRIGVRTQRHRLDAQGALFDLTEDPSQKTDLSPKLPALAERLKEAAKAWREDVFGSAEALSGAVQASKSVAGPALDDRTIPIGFPSQPRVVLPAGEAQAYGGVRRSNRFPNCTYFTDWTRGAEITWEIEVAEAGEFAVGLHYACKAADVGSVLQLSFRQQPMLTTSITQAWDPPLRDKEDRVPRQESYMKDFRPMALGTIRLEPGRGPLTLRAIEVPGIQAAEVFLLTLTRVTPGQSR